mmetsp:Transcript_24781/g.50246  ORF Transcript_24781/g.50246 Transcript_24781/m.50246 type:complete len:337 (+) Transcript_24781:95-1105(+)
MEIAAYCLLDLPTLLQACAPLCASLHLALTQKRRLVVGSAWIPCGLAELLARRATGLEILELEGQHFSLELLRSERCLCLRLSILQATVLGPLLRCSPALESVLVTPSADRAGIWPSEPLDMRCIRSFPAGRQIRWRSLFQHRGSDVLTTLPGRLAARDMPACDAECILVAGLARPDEPDAAQSEPGPSPFPAPCRRRRAARLPREAVRETRELALDGRLLGVAARQSLKFMSKRCGVQIKAFGAATRSRPVDRWTILAMWLNNLLEPSFGWIVLLSLLAMVWLRSCEDSYARSTGYNGALLSTHPLKTVSFAERLQHSAFVDGGHLHSLAASLEM